MDHVDKIAKIITEDPDVFNEMALSTGAIGAGIPAPLQQSRKHRQKSEMQKKYYADPVSGQPRAKGTGDKKEGEVLYSDKQSEDPELSVE